jgi:hypothetical protein
MICRVELAHETARLAGGEDVSMPQVYGSEVKAWICRRRLRPGNSNGLASEYFPSSRATHKNRYGNLPISVPLLPNTLLVPDQIQLRHRGHNETVTSRSQTQPMDVKETSPRARYFSRLARGREWARHGLGLDRAVVFTVLARGWTSASGLVTVALMPEGGLAHPDWLQLP